ncbi:unnamed protein product [Ambrosiozyma monospora]|uniref:Unnamed protein product n=1 Tax=Ambrosiozyma monospora TaxID=43982 RepID=A0ACB5T0I0_AMBMO|nr:unnamed protein product [Ambrosiozyma monospora]
MYYRKKELGEAGLKKLADNLKQAQEKNDAPIPKSVIEGFKKPDPSNIHFIETHAIGAGLNKDVENDLSNEATKKVLKDTPTNFPLYVNIQDIESNFVTIHLLFSSFEIDDELLPFIHPFKTLFSLPVENDDGTLISYEDVVKQLKRDTVQSAISTGFLGCFDEFVNFKLTVKYENYDTAIEWLTKLLFKSKFTKERVSVAIEKLVNSLPDSKRDGPTMQQSLANNHIFTDRSLTKASDQVSNEDFLRGLLAKIEDGKYDEIEKKIEAFRKQLLKLNNLRVLIIGDVNKLDTPVSSWNKFIKESKQTSKVDTVTEIPQSSKVLSEIGESKSEKAFILTTPGSESSYMGVTTKIPFEYTSSDSFKITLAAEYLQCVEGPFWRGIRGTGLAYGASIYKEVEIGQLSFYIYRGADIEKSYEVGKEIVEGFISGKTPIDEKMLQGAISSVVFNLTNSQSNYFQSAGRNFLDDVLMKRGPNYSHRLLKELSQITADDLVYIFKKYFGPLFDSSSSSCYIVCHPSKLEGVEKYFAGLGYKTSVEHAKVAEGEVLEDGSEEEDSEFDSDEEETDDDTV